MHTHTHTHMLHVDDSIDSNNSKKIGLEMCKSKTSSAADEVCAELVRSQMGCVEVVDHALEERRSVCGGVSSSADVSLVVFLRPDARALTLA